jgi:hypothetical protein
MRFLPLSSRDDRARFYIFLGEFSISASGDAFACIGEYMLDQAKRKKMKLRQVTEI